MTSVRVPNESGYHHKDWTSRRLPPRLLERLETTTALSQALDQMRGAGHMGPIRHRPGGADPEEPWRWLSVFAPGASSTESAVTEIYRRPGSHGLLRVVRYPFRAL